MHMKISAFATAAAILLAAGLHAVPANAAASATTKECSDQWAKLKADNKVPAGMTWPKFLSQCSKEAATGDAGASAAADNPPKKEVKSKLTKTAAVDEDEGTSSAAQKKTCDTKWGAYKQQKGVHGWKAYFTFMADCM